MFALYLMILHCMISEFWNLILSEFNNFTSYPLFTFNDNFVPLKLVTSKLPLKVKSRHSE